MRVAFKESFEKDLKKVGDNKVLGRLKKIIESVEAIQSLGEIKNLKKLKKRGHYYRIRLGDYRVGLTVEGNVVTFVRFLDRKDLYRYFP